MKLRAISLVMIASLLASMFLIGIGTAQFNKDIDWPKFAIILPGPYTYGPQDMNVSAAPPFDIGYKFNITIQIQNVTDMTAYGVTIVWNSTYMNMTRWFLSDFFKAKRDAGEWSSAMLAFWTNDLRTRPGYELLPPRIGAFCGLGQTALGDEYNVDGTLDICKIEFRINSYGPLGFYIWKEPKYYKPWPYAGAYPYLQQEAAFPEAFHITYSGWMTLGATKQDYNVRWSKNPYFAPPAPLTGRVSSAMLWIHPPMPRPPSCEVSVSPAFPMVDDTVTATVTTTPGFDGTTPRPVTMVILNWGVGANETDNTPPFVFTHAYTAAGSYIIKVWCYAEGMPPPLAWCYKEKPITVLERALTGIDVYQVRKPIWPGDPGGKSGEGPKVPGRPYDPQSLVVLEAYVFYNGEPVQSKIVSFEVRWECQQCILYRTDRTGDDPRDPRDADGIAWIEFRIPELCWEYGGPEALFGKWCVIVTVEMCEVKFNDTMWFDVGYILTLSNMAPVEDSYKKCEYVEFTVSVTNIDWLTVPATMILVVYDDNEVPIGQQIIDIDVPPGEFCNPTTINVTISLHIPKYAYVGIGTGYINLFTALPSECGLAYCPEVSAQFLILKSK